MTETIVVNANVGDSIELVFTNGDTVSGEVSVPPYGNESIRLRTLFAGDTYISLRSLLSYTIKEARVETAPFEPEGEGYIWGYIKMDSSKTDSYNDYQIAVYRSPNGLWHFEGKTGAWPALYDRVKDMNHDKPFEFVLLEEKA